MQCLRVNPGPALHDLVESIWIQDGEASPEHDEPSRVLPTGTVELLLHYGDPFVHWETAGNVQMPLCYLTGQRTRSVLPSATGRIGIVIVSLHPWGVESLFSGASDIVDGYTDLSRIIPKASVALLQERLSEATDHHDRIRIVQAFLLRRRSERVADLRMVAASRLLAASTQTSIRALAREFRMSPRHFSRTFRAEIGIPPKTFARIMRFQNALRLQRENRLGWADIAAECGYSDQPHLIREMKEFADYTPTNLPIHREGLHQAFNGTDASGYFDTVYL